jgi:hypothetical protein
MWDNALMDDLSRRKRSQVMAAIRSKGDKNTELKSGSILRARGITSRHRYRLSPENQILIFPRSIRPCLQTSVSGTGADRPAETSKQPRILTRQARHRRCNSIFRVWLNTSPQIYLHIVFAVEGRQYLIQPGQNGELQKYIGGIIPG